MLRTNRKTQATRMESKNATLQGLVEFLKNKGACDIDVTARTNYGTKHLVSIGFGRDGIYCAAEDSDIISIKDIRPNALVEIADQLGVEESKKTR